MPDITLLVETADLRKALAATHKFTQPKLDDLACVRVRATDTVTYVAATNGSAGALAIVSTIALDIDTDTDDAIAEFDLSVGDVQKVLKVFTGSEGDDETPGNELRLEVDSEHLTVTDASGMFEGQQLILPRQPHRQYGSSVMNSLATWVHQRPSGPPEHETVLFGPHLALFVGACKVYGQNIILEFHTTGADRDRTATVVRCGEDFIGVIASRWEDEEAVEQRQEHRAAWARRIPSPVTVEVVRP